MKNSHHKTIWKFELKRDRNELQFPKHAKILFVGSQFVAGNLDRETITIWAEVDPSATTELRNFLVYGTGWPLPEDMSKMKFLGTSLLYRTSLVYHVYEELGVEQH